MRQDPRRDQTGLARMEEQRIVIEQLHTATNNAMGYYIVDIVMFSE
jgi:hypothetical protein